MVLSFFRNKHVIIAMFVAPILAVLSWYLVDHFVAEKPHRAVSGNSYPLLAMSNCRYQSGVCTLKNADIELKLRASQGAGSGTLLTMSSELPLNGVLVSLTRDGVDGPPVEQPPLSMTSTAASRTQWTLDVGNIEPATSMLRIVVDIDGSLYYVETGTVFIDYSTTFSRDNFNQ